MNIDEDALHVTLGDRVRVARKKAGMSQDGLALNLSMPTSAVAAIEAGLYCPPLLAIYQIALFFKVPIGDLLPRVESVLVELSDKEELLREQVTLKERLEVLQQDAARMKLRLEEVSRMVRDI